MTSSTVVVRSTSKTQSVSEAFSSGTRTASPFRRPSSSGKMSPIAVAEPVVVGISESDAARARRRSVCGASTTVWVFVMSCSVVIEPWRMPIPSWIALTTGREAVRRARRRRHDLVRVGVVAVVVDSHHDVQDAAALDGRGDDDPRHAAREERRKRLRRAELARALEHDVNAEVRPGNVAGLGAPAERDRLTVDLERAADGCDLARPAPVDRVELEQVRAGRGVARQLVHVHEAQVVPVPAGAQC